MYDSCVYNKSMNNNQQPQYAVLTVYGTTPILLGEKLTLRQARNRGKSYSNYEIMLQSEYEQTPFYKRIQEMKR